jgi:diketogulonate reductase-like aldo/keto reductase
VLLHNGVKVPALACGTGGDNSESAQVTVNAALTAGIRHIDTAYDYGDQAGVGKAVRQWDASRASGSDPAFLTTKVPGCGVPTQGLMPPCFNNTLKLFEEDASLLGRGVDLLLIHFPPLLGCIPANCKHMQEQWHALEQLLDTGKVRAIGVSNYCKKCLQCIMETATVMPMVNQVQYHVGMGPDFGSGLLQFCAQNDIAAFAYSPLGGGRVLAADSPFTTLAKQIAPGYKWDPKAHGESWAPWGKNVTAAQIALAWIGQKRGALPQLGLVTKSNNPTYLWEDLGSMGSPAWGWQLTTQDRGALDELGGSALACKHEAPGGCCK